MGVGCTYFTEAGGFSSASACSYREKSRENKSNTNFQSSVAKINLKLKLPREKTPMQSRQY
jgi:hypothetical protein